MSAPARPQPTAPQQSAEAVEYVAVFTAIQTVEHMAADLDRVLRLLQDRRAVLRDILEEQRDVHC